MFFNEAMMCNHHMRIKRYKDKRNTCTGTCLSAKRDNRETSK